MPNFAGVGEQVFRFKQFEIDQCDCAMKVGTDGVLLGAWVQLLPNDNVLDVGTGTGLIAMMLAQRELNCNIDAIEVEPECLQRAQYNFARTPWADRLQAFEADYNTWTDDKTYDLIVSNPPYFTNSTPSPEATRNRARHTDSLSLDVLIIKSASLLSDTGRMALVLPADSLDKVKIVAGESGLSIARLTRVKGNREAEVKRILIELSKQSVRLLEEELVIEEARRQYTSAYKALTKDFYLAM